MLRSRFGEDEKSVPHRNRSPFMWPVTEAVFAERYRTSPGCIRSEALPGPQGGHSCLTSMGGISLQGLSFLGHDPGGNFDLSSLFGRALDPGRRVACHKDTLEKETIRLAEGIPHP